MTERPATDVERIFGPTDPSRQLVEMASWRLATEVVRRYPSTLRIVETHPGGGQYDCLTLVAGQRSDLDRIDLNRAGSVFVWQRHQESWSWVWRGAWAEAVASDDSKKLADRLCAKAGLAGVERPPPTSAATIGFRVASAFLAHAAFGRTFWECRNGYEDTSGYGGGVRRNLFEAFPGATARLEMRESGDFLDVPAYRFWFLVKDGAPSLAFEVTSGLAWLLDGRELDLLALYRAFSHRVWHVVWTIAGDLLP